MSTEPDDPPETPAQRTRSSRMAVAAVVTAVLLAGGGSAWWAAANNGGGSGAKATPAPLRMDGPGLSTDVTGGGPATTGGGTSYQLTGTLPKGPDDAAVYRASGPVPQSAVRHLAALLGMSGPVASDHDLWRVGGGTNDGPALLVGKSAPGTWSYTRSGPPAVGADPDGSTSSSGTPLDTRPDVVGGASTGSGSGSASGSGSGSAPVSEAAAKATAKPLLAGLGLSGAAVDASQTAGAVRLVSADPTVGGMPTHGWSTSLQIGTDGKVTLGYGRLSDLAKGATYPVVSAATALKELNATPVMHPDYGIESCQVPESGSGASSAQAPSTAPGQDNPTDKRLPHSLPCLPDNGHPTQVRGAVFGLALQYVSGTQTLVPAWLFRTAPAGASRTSVVAQTAVDPSYIRSGPGATATAAPPSSVPSVNPGGPEVSPSPASPPVTKGSHGVAVDSYTVNGRTLTLAFVGGLCDTYAGSASESTGQVKVAVTATPKKPGTMCPAIAKSLTVQVTLAQPLGSRTVVDLSSGQPLRSGQPLPGR